jgi:hypothetical protein
MKKNEVEVFDLPHGIELLEKFNLKRVVEGRGHDCGGLIAELCIKSKKILDYHDDGWGGEPEQHFVDEKARKIAENALKEGKCAQIMVECGWNYGKNPEELTIDNQIDFLVCSLATYRDIQKIMKNTKKWLIWGTKFNYRYYSWKNVTNLNQLSSGVIQGAYFQAKLKLKDGEKFFNTDEQLLSLGIPKNRL